MVNNLDFNEILKNVNVKKSVSITRIVFYGIIVIILIYFALTFSSLNQRKKEIECIEYYNALGIKLRGCDHYVNDYQKLLEGDFDEE